MLLLIDGIFRFHIVQASYAYADNLFFIQEKTYGKYGEITLAQPEKCLEFLYGQMDEHMKKRNNTRTK